MHTLPTLHTLPHPAHTAECSGGHVYWLVGGASPPGSVPSGHAMLCAVWDLLLFITVAPRFGFLGIPCASPCLGLPLALWWPCSVSLVTFQSLLMLQMVRGWVGRAGWLSGGCQCSISPPAGGSGPHGPGEAAQPDTRQGPGLLCPLCQCLTRPGAPHQDRKLPLQQRCRPETQEVTPVTEIRYQSGLT